MAKLNHTTPTTNRDRESLPSGVATRAGDPADASDEGSTSMNMQTAITANTRGDAELLATDDRMQEALRKIEAHGIFYHAEEHSPAEVEDYDHANDFVGRQLATTVEGALAKAWLAWAANTEGGSERKLHFWDLVRRRDLAALQQMEHELDWEHHTMLTLIRSLTSILEDNEHAAIARRAPHLASELERHSKRASKMDELLLRTSHVLHAIDHGGLLDAAPTGDEADYQRHSAAVGLLHMLQDEITRYEADDEETSLFISLSVRASELSKAE